MDINKLIVRSQCPICGGNMNHDTDIFCTKNCDYRVSMQYDVATIWLSQHSFPYKWSAPRIAISVPMNLLSYNEEDSMVYLEYSLIEESKDLEDFFIKIREEVDRIQKLKSFL